MSADRVGARVAAVIEEMRANGGATTITIDGDTIDWADRLTAALDPGGPPLATEAGKVMLAAVEFAEDPTVPASELPNLLDDLIDAARRTRYVTT